MIDVTDVGGFDLTERSSLCISNLTHTFFNLSHLFRILLLAVKQILFSAEKGL